MGPKPTGANKDWPESILRASEAIIPLQYGTNKFASQKGMRIGGARDVLPHIKGLKKEGEEEPKDGEPRNNPSECMCSNLNFKLPVLLPMNRIRELNFIIFNF